MDRFDYLWAVVWQLTGVIAAMSFWTAWQFIFVGHGINPLLSVPVGMIAILLPLLIRSE